MAAVEVGQGLQPRDSSVSVDIDPGWYEGQPETADVGDDTHHQRQHHTTPSGHALPAAGLAALPGRRRARASRGPSRRSSGHSSSRSRSSSGGGAAPGGAASPASHVPTVLTKLQKWGDYESFGAPVWPTRFIPMKTPLSADILEHWALPAAPRHRLTVAALLDAQAAAGRRVGLLLDLSNHDCLYEADLPPCGVEYRHVQLVAKELPPLAFVRQVAAAANAFWARQPDAYVAIHCAYGFNRTGFVVASYLVEHCGLSADQALASFAASRPPGVKHERFRQELHVRYGSSGGGRALPTHVRALLPAQGPAQQAGAEGAVAAAASGGAAAASSSSSSSCATACLLADASSSGPAGADGSSCCGPDAAAATGCSRPVEPAAAALPAAAAAAAGSSEPLAPMRHYCSCCGAEMPEADEQQQLPATSGSSVRSSCTVAAAGSAGSSAHGAPQQLSPSSSGRVPLSSSPAAHMPARCWSSNSMGENSSIGCSPDSSGVDLLSLRVSSLLSTTSGSGLDAGGGSQAGSDARPMSAAAAGGGGGGSHRQQQQQRVQFLLGRRASGSFGDAGGSGGGGDSGRCSASGRAPDAGSESDAAPDVDLDGGEDATTEEGCFEMDQEQQQQQQQSPLHERLRPQVRQRQQHQQQQPCCAGVAPCCPTQPLQHADLDALLASVSIPQQQQQQQQQHMRQQPREPLHCPSCGAGQQGTAGHHHQQQQALQQHQRRPWDAGGGSHHQEEEDEEEEAAAAGGGMPPRPPRPLLAGGGAARRGSSGDGGAELVENESFGKLTSAELLRNLRTLRRSNAAN